MEGEQFSLCWNNFHNNLRTGFHSLLQDEDLVDVTLAAEGRYLKAHKTVLSVCSPYFKELFRANPCKHPIVILQDVNYSALKSLLQFMYQGEVSVSQDEIPTFMRVAEMLKIKGLTENDTNTSNTPTDTNGITDSNRSSPFMYGEPRQMLKRSRPSSKKIIRPIQHLRPIESPKTVKSPASIKSQHVASPQPPLKKHCTDDRMDDLEHPINPKQEPVDHDDDDDEFNDENNLDMSSMLDTTLNESHHASASWTPDLKVPADTSSPGGLLFLKSRKGHPVLINNGHIYTLSHKRDNRSTWYCVKRNTLNCEGCLITTSGSTLLSYSGHNHAQLNDIIQRLQAYSCTSTSSQ